MPPRNDMHINRAMKHIAQRFVRAAALFSLLAGGMHGQAPSLKPAAAPIPIKVVVVTMYQRGEDTGGNPGEFQFWVEREHLDQVLPLAAGYHHVRLNKDGVLGMLTGVATAKAAASVMALGLDPRFDLSNAYWIVAGIGGGDPADVSLGSAVWAEHVIDGDIAFEIDAREIPPGWPTGYVPLRKSTPYEQPIRGELEGEIYTLNPGLVDWAYERTRGITLADDAVLVQLRKPYAGPGARPPFVLEGERPTARSLVGGAIAVGGVIALALSG